MNDTFPLADRTVRRVGFGAMQLPGPGVFGPPRDRDDGDRRAPPGRRARRRPHRHRPVLRTRRRQRADPRGAAPVSRRPRARVQGRRASRRRPAAGFRRRRPGRAAGRRGGQPAHPRRRAARRGQPAPAWTSTPTVRRQPVPSRGPARRDGGAARRGQDRRRRDLHGRPRPQVRRGDQHRRASSACRTRSAWWTSNDCRRARRSAPSRPSPTSPYFPLGLGLPGTCRRSPTSPRCRQWASGTACPPAQVGLAWLLARADNVLLIPGTSSAAHLEENMAVAELSLTPDDLAELAAAASPPA